MEKRGSREENLVYNLPEHGLVNESLWEDSYGIWITYGPIQPCLDVRGPSVNEIKTRSGMEFS